MKTRDYISLIAIERLLEDQTLPADIRQQAEQVLLELIAEKWKYFDVLDSLGVSTKETLP